MELTGGAGDIYAAWCSALPILYPIHNAGGFAALGAIRALGCIHDLLPVSRLRYFCHAASLLLEKERSCTQPPRRRKLNPQRGARPQRTRDCITPSLHDTPRPGLAEASPDRLRNSLRCPAPPETVPAASTAGSSSCPAVGPHPACAASAARPGRFPGRWPALSCLPA